MAMREWARPPATPAGNRFHTYWCIKMHPTESTSSECWLRPAGKLVPHEEWWVSLRCTHPTSLHPPYLTGREVLSRGALGFEDCTALASAVHADVQGLVEADVADEGGIAVGLLGGEPVPVDGALACGGVDGEVAHP